MTDDFESSICRVIAGIPRGEVMTYGEVAAAAGFPRAARAVGNWLRVTAEDVPWWRVVGWDGSLRSGDPAEQAARLLAENVTVVGSKVKDEAGIRSSVEVQRSTGNT